MTLGKAKWILVGYVVLDLLIGYAGVIPLGQAAAAQFTTVTGTVVDPNGLPYSFGTIVPTLVTSASPTLNGFPYTPPTQPIGLDSTGSFTMQLGDNTVLLPAATKWNFLVCSAVGTIQPAGGKGPVCFSLAAPITISGASQSISANLNAVALALSAITSGTTLTINPTNGVIPVRSNATTFIDSPLSVSGGNVTNTGTLTLAIQGTTCNPSVNFTGFTASGLAGFTGSGLVGLCNSSSSWLSLNASTLTLPTAGVMGFAANATFGSGPDTAFSRTAAGVMACGTGSALSTACRLKAAAYMSVGTTATSNAGCGEGALVGGATAGKFTTAGTTSCTTIVTMGNSATSPNGWDCHIVDLTTAADFANPHESASTTTTVTFVSGTIVASDVLQFSCIGY